MKPFWVCRLCCSDGSYYIGHTDNLEKRMAEHSEGDWEWYTSTRLPIELVWSREFATRMEVLEREKQIKGWSRAKKEALIIGDWKQIKNLSRRRPSTRPFGVR